jgi:uncharacterized membrane protein YhaH (DUF805 family)
MFALFLVVVVAAVLVVAFGGRAKQSQHSAFRFSEIWSFSGQVGRGAYAAVGVIGLALKHNLDRAVATFVFHRPFGIFNYWIPPVDAVRISSLSHDDAVFLVTMVGLSLVFIWVGLAMTLKRLRSAGLPLWLVALFFIPVLNLIFFIVLCFVPPAESSNQRQMGDSALSRVIPESMLGSAVAAVIPMGIIGTGIAYLSVQTIGTYGWGVFVALPFCLGLGAVMIYTFHRPRALGSCVLVSLLAVALVALVLFAVAVEGLICILMALPIGAPLALLGGIIGYLIQRGRLPQTQTTSFMLMAVLLPAGFIGVEGAAPATPKVYDVSTTITINAPASKIWNNLIAFPDLPDPKLLLFQAGVSHPIRATIDGEGVGATRACLFSTGTFIERIDGWEKDKRLAFSVVSKAEAMQELSPYNIHPRHLDGYFDPVRAEFTLHANPDGTTTLEGRSWYRNSMWPAGYWRLWSDKILHDVHQSVFEHLKRLSETP